MEPRPLNETEKDYLPRHFIPCCDECTNLNRYAEEPKGPFGLRSRIFNKCTKLGVELTHNLTHQALAPCKLEQFCYELWIEYHLDIVVKNGNLVVV